jgi:DNA-binding MarR family transcriptional regulator
MPTLTLVTPHEPTPSPAELAADLRRAISALVRTTRPTDELAPSPAAVLDLLDTRGPLTTAELAAARGVRHQTMAATVKDLTEAGHVSAEPDPADARKKLLTLTPSGTSAIRDERRRRVARLADAVDAALDDADRRTLARALELVDRVTNAVAQRRPAGPDGQPLTGDW